MGTRMSLMIVAIACGVAAGCGTPFDPTYTGASPPSPDWSTTPPPTDNALAITPSTLPDAQVGTPYSQALSTNGIVPVQWSVTGNLPAGLAIEIGSGTAVNFLQGTCTIAGSYSFAIQVTDATGATAQQSYGLMVDPAVATAFVLSPLDNASLPDATLGQPYSQTVDVVSGGTPPYSVSGFGFAVAGLTIEQLTPSSCSISGTPTQTGAFVVTIQVQDAAGQNATESYYLNVTAPPPVFILAPAASSQLSGAVVGQAYSQTIAIVSSVMAPCTFTGLTVPPGLAVVQSSSSSFAIAGTPTLAGSFTLQVQVQDAAERTETESYSLTVFVASGPLAISPAVIPNGQVGVSYAEPLNVPNANGAVQWSVAGTLPPGITLDGSGNLSGVFTASGSYSFTVQATDSTGATALQSYTVSVN
jgi:hypothetical protein